VELRFQQVESRCVMVIDNRTDTAVTLDGDSSAIVDPRGQTRAIATQLIPAGAYAKLILPPMAEYDPHGPQWHFGIGVGARVDAKDLGPSGAGDRHAVYLVTSTEPMEYWEWSGAGEVRVVLALKQGDQTHRHEIVVRRIKK
jgi:hypothetical protein